MRILVGVLAILLSGGLGSADVDCHGEKGPYTLNVVGGMFYGPGKIAKSPLPPGTLSHIELNCSLTGGTAFFNNGAAPPNIASEAEMGGEPDGRLSNGRLFNEHIDGGIAEVGGGMLRMMTVIAGEGPNEGRENYTLTPAYNWNLRTDLALDPGFPEGLVVSENLLITTGINRVPFSVQTQLNIPGGQDRASELPSGTPVVGRLGDYDGDGYLDGRLIGASTIQLEHMLMPGAPVLQTRRFTSNIPIAPVDAALLMAAGLENIAEVWAFANDPEQTGPAQAYVQANWADYIAETNERLQAAQARVDHAALDAEEAKHLHDLLGRASAHAEALSEWTAQVAPEMLHTNKWVQLETSQLFAINKKIVARLRTHTLLQPSTGETEQTGS